jgi:hypothetical protein
LLGGFVRKAERSLTDVFENKIPAKRCNIGIEYSTTSSIYFSGSSFVPFKPIFGTMQISVEQMEKSLFEIDTGPGYAPSSISKICASATAISLSLIFYTVIIFLAQNGRIRAKNFGQISFDLGELSPNQQILRLNNGRKSPKSEKIRPKFLRANLNCADSPGSPEKISTVYKDLVTLMDSVYSR